MTDAPAGWQPIETAPRDGREVLVLVPLSEALGNGRRIRADVPVRARFDRTSGGWRTVPHGDSIYPEHWMPPPPAPPIRGSARPA
jgi:hypothetical protein